MHSLRSWYPGYYPCLLLTLLLILSVCRLVFRQKDKVCNVRAQEVVECMSSVSHDPYSHDQQQQAPDEETQFCTCLPPVRETLPHN